MKNIYKLIFAIVIMILIVSLIIFSFIKKEFVTQKATDVTITQGASVKEISQILEENNVIKNANYFYYYIKFKNKFLELTKQEPLTILFKEGNYSFSVGDFNNLIEQLNSGESGSSAANSFTMVEGTGIDNLVSTLAKMKLGSEKEILATLQDEAFYNSMKEKFTWLPAYNPNKIYQFEGYLHPNTYRLDKNSTVASIIETMLSETNEIYKDAETELSIIGLNFDQMLTLASVVEAESKYSKDRPKVAQVFLNRLAAGMKLESDITAGYANQEHKVFMYYKDIKTDSPYNTYATPALPLGPINSPSTQSINGVLYPEGPSFKALYFYARPSGETFYAETFQQHEKNRLKFESEWKELEQN